MALTAATHVGLFALLNVLAVPPRNERGRTSSAEREEIGRWLNKHAPPTATVFAGDIGYYVNRRVVDDGLADASGLGWKLRSGELSMPEFLPLRAGYGSSPGHESNCEHRRYPVPDHRKVTFAR